jgi:hypothetical protein
MTSAFYPRSLKIANRRTPWKAANYAENLVLQALQFKKKNHICCKYLDGAAKIHFGYATQRVPFGRLNRSLFNRERTNRCFDGLDVDRFYLYLHVTFLSKIHLIYKRNVPSVQCTVSLNCSMFTRKSLNRRLSARNELISSTIPYGYCNLSHIHKS